MYAAPPEPPDYWFRSDPDDAEDLSQLKREMAEAGARTARLILREGISRALVTACMDT